MEIFESILRIVHDPDGANVMLLDYGTALESDDVDAVAGQEVSEALILKAPGIKTIPRGNERFEIEFTILEPMDKTTTAVAAAMNHGLTLPKTSAPLLLAMEDGWNWVVDSATVRSWPAGSSGVLSRRTINIVGGALSVTNSPGDGNEYTRPDGFSKYLRPA